MPNITVTVSERTYRRARVRAAELDTSVSALVARTLEAFASEETTAETRRRRLAELRGRTPAFAAAKRLSRADLYNRADR